MSDLINRQDAIDAIVNTPTDVYSHDRVISVLDGAAFRQNEIIDIINALPSAQPEIIRCKDCRWGKEVCGNIECFADSYAPDYHGYEWFCPNGERKGEQNDKNENS